MLTFRHTLLAGLLALSFPACADAQFVIPEVCKNGVTGDVDFDPIVIISRSIGEVLVKDFEVLGPIAARKRWLLKLTKPANDIYFVFVNYTPFLTSNLTLKVSTSPPASFWTLPAAGAGDGKNLKIFPTFTLTVSSPTGGVVPNAIVDFIPPFDGSSPFTMQADGKGEIVINCIQQAPFGAYDVTVSDDKGAYLYDGIFVASGKGTGATGPRPKSGAASR